MTEEDATAQEQVDTGRDDDEEAAFERELAAEVAAHDEELGAAVADLEERAADLEADLAAREEEVDELTERLQRTQADFQNYKKRAKKRQEQLEKRATEDLVARLLDVRDNLTRAVTDESGDLEALREGVEMTLDEFDHVLDAEGVSEIEPEPGSEVDPERHEVMLRVDSDEPEDTIAEVYRPGYEMAGKVLRTAQVTVSDGSNGEE
ncbi:nucleotide exchange factor GrpE [Halobacteriaceae archaeon GCM10025711]